MGKVTRDSISVGGMPWPLVMMIIVGAVRSGKTLMGMRTAATPPQIKITTPAAVTSQRLSRDQSLGTRNSRAAGFHFLK